jgi:hypothetical protein
VSEREKLVFKIDAKFFYDRETEGYSSFLPSPFSFYISLDAARGVAIKIKR